MCVTPIILPEVGPIRCRKCWQCRVNRVDDYVGRCIAESRHCDLALGATFTYGGGDRPEAAVLTYRDFQLFMKRLRKAGYDVRYIVAGEYGSLKGRAHWHAVLFFTGKVPEVEKYKRISWDFWTEGLSWFEDPSYETIRYLLKYTLKEQTDGGSARHLAMSKKPPLGDAYVRELAAKYVASGLAPQSWNYQLPGILDSKGRLRNFRWQGASRRNLMRYFLEGWKANRSDPPPVSELVEDAEDEAFRDDPYMLWHSFVQTLNEKARNSWAFNDRPKVVKARVVSSDFMPMLVTVDELGAHELVGVGEYGGVLWRQRLRTRAELRAALRGDRHKLNALQQQRRSVRS